MLRRLFRQGRGEQYDDLINRAAQLGQEWNDRLTLNNRRFVERYANAELRLLVYLRRFRSCRPGIEQRAVFQAAVGGSDANGWSDNRLVCPGRLELESKNDCLATRPDCKQQPMLVDYVKLMQSPQSVMPSLVWLESSNDGSGRRDDSLFCSLESGFKFVSVVRDYEEVALHDVLTAAFNELTPQQIEGGSEVVNRISCNERQSRRWKREYVETILQLSRIGDYISDDLIGFTLMKPLDRDFQLVDVLVGPFDLKTGAGQSVVGHPRSIT